MVDLTAKTAMGDGSPPRRYEIDRSMICRFAQSIQSDWPPYYDVEAARNLGYHDVVAPPTFAISLVPAPIPGLDLPTAGLIHGEQRFQYGEPIVAGDTIVVTHAVAHDRVRGDSRFVTLQTLATNQNQRVVCTSTMVLMMKAESK